MEASVENGVYLAVPCDVYVILGHFLLGRIVGPCVYTADTRREVEYRC